MTLDELQAKLPAQFQPWAVQFGPAILAMTAEELKAWIDLLIRGDVLGAYEKLLTGMATPELLADWHIVTADWQAANVKNADRIDLQKSAMIGVVKIALAIALASVGL